MSHRMRSILLRTGFVLAVVFVAFIASGVILAQSSPDFDLGCRSELTAGGYAGYYAGIGANSYTSVGQPMAGRATIQGSGIILESGFILPVAQTDWSTIDASSSVAGADANAAHPLYLPAIYKVVRYVRPCNWPWAATTQVAQ